MDLGRDCGACPGQYCGIRNISRDQFASAARGKEIKRDALKAVKKIAPLVQMQTHRIYAGPAKVSLIRGETNGNSKIRNTISDLKNYTYIFTPSRAFPKASQFP